jgi:hypothetical protein
VPRCDPREELRADAAPVEHSEALLEAYEVLQRLHDRGILAALKGALGASDMVFESVVDVVKTQTNDMLTIKGEKKVEKEQEEGDYYHSERSYQLRREVLQSFLTPNSARFHVRSDRTRTA